MTASRSIQWCVMILALVGVGSVASAKTISVVAGQSIQAAINVAVAGDVVVVAKGTYKERLNFKGKAITVKSTNPASKTVVAATILNGDKKGSVVTFRTGEKATSILTGFTITNGSGTLSGGTKVGGGVVCSNGSSPTLTNNAIGGNSAAWGGGVMCAKSSPILTGNTISGNKASTATKTGVGGGVFCYDHSSPRLANNTLSGNSADRGGGGVYCTESSPALTHNTISNNTVGNSLTRAGGAGVMCVKSSPTLTDNTISGNSIAMLGGGGGGMMCYDHSSPTLTNNTISNNWGGEGGGVFCDVYSSPTMTGNTISGNGRLDSVNCGGGLACENFSSPVLTNNIISGNKAGDDGGGLYCCKSASPVLINNTLSGNSATHHGGGASIEYPSVPVFRNSIIAFSTKGGGLHVEVEFNPGHPAKPVITYCDVYSNTGGNYVNWPDQTGKNGNISKNPLFAWAAKGNFHEKSKGGRWSGSAWVKDTVQSPCIDAGNPASAFALEPAPNGGRINMGAYGNTKYASKSAPNSATAGLLVSAAAAPTTGGGAQFSVSLSAAASVAVTITNLAGRPVAALPASDLPEGMSTLLWSGKGNSGLRVPSGTYLARLTARTEEGGQSQALATVSVLR